MVFDSSTNSPDVWLYSPDGNCQMRLGLLNNSTNKLFNKCIMAVLDKKVLICLQASINVCYQYDAVSNKLVEITGPGVENVGGTFQLGKLVLFTRIGIKMTLDPVTRLWSNDTDTNYGTSFTCCVSWKNVTLAFQFSVVIIYDGGKTTYFNNGPFDMVDSGCATLPNGNILVAGCSSSSSCSKAFAEYNVPNNTWSSVKYGSADYSYSLALLLGKRVLILVTAEVSPIVHEYFYENSTMSSSSYDLPTDFKLLRKRVPCATMVPASWYSNVSGGCEGVT